MHDRNGAHDQFAKGSANSNHLPLKKLAERKYCRTKERSSSTTTDYNRFPDLDERNWALRRAVDKATGSDGIGYPLLRKLPPFGRLAVVATMSEVWQSGLISDVWKEGLFVPIIKPGKDKTG